VLNAAAHVVTGTWKFDRGLGQILHDDLHWLDVLDWVFFKLVVTVHRCLNGRGMAEIAGVDIAGVDNDGVSRRGEHIDEGVRRFHKVKSSSRVITAQTAQDYLKTH